MRDSHKTSKIDKVNVANAATWQGLCGVPEVIGLPDLGIMMLFVVDRHANARTQTKSIILPKAGILITHPKSTKSVLRMLPHGKDSVKVQEAI